MNAPLLKLHCPICKGTQESMTILLPEHERDNDFVDITDRCPEPCPGSNTLASHFVDTCPACENHGRRQDCVICHGKNKVLTPINIEIERKYDDESIWETIPLGTARLSLGANFKNADDVISAIYSGMPVRTPWAEFRIKPRVNAPQEVSNGK